MDTFIEQIVKKKKTAVDGLIIFGLVVAALVVSFAAFLFLRTFGLLIAFGVFYGAWWLISGRNTEFEYSVTNGDIDIDQIIAKRKRKRLVSVSGKKVESLLPYDPAASQAGYQRVVVAAPSANEAGLWCFTYHSKKSGHTLVIFQPDERVLKALFGGLQKLVQMETTRAARELGIVLSASRYGHGDEE